MGKFFGLLKGAFFRYLAHNCGRMAAALTFYAIFSLAPMLLIAVAVTGWVYGEGQARQALEMQVAEVMGPEAAALAGNTAERAGERGGLGFGIGTVILLLASSRALAELRQAMNEIWEVDLATTKEKISSMIRGRLLAFVIVLGFGLLLIASVILSSILAGATGWVEHHLPFSSIVALLINESASVLIFALLFGLVFKYLPARKIPFADVWPGALLTGLIFTAAKWALSLYVGQSAVTSAYGAAGTLIAVLLWIFFSSQIFLFGAEFTRVYAEQRNSRTGTT
jgi:membrane protein